MHKIKVEASKWAQEKGAPYNEPIDLTVARVDLNDDEQVEEFDDRKCPSCPNTFDVLKIVFEMTGTKLAVAYLCPCAHIWSKDLQEVKK